MDAGEAGGVKGRPLAMNDFSAPISRDEVIDAGIVHKTTDRGKLVANPFSDPAGRRPCVAQP